MSTMECVRCCRITEFDEQNVQIVTYVQAIDSQAIMCVNCTTCVGVQTENKWKSINELLTDNRVNGAFEVCTQKEKVVHYILSQVLHNMVELNVHHHETKYDIPDVNDKVIILWWEYEAVGFYTVKPKATWIEDVNKFYTLVTLDTMYVIKKHRRKGYCCEMLKHLCASYPDEDIGFSKPISLSMKRVLLKFLMEHHNLRLKFWVVENDGSEGNRKLLWYTLLAEKSRRAVDVECQYQNIIP